MLIAPVVPSARLQTNEVAGPCDEQEARQHHRGASAADACSSERRPTRSESAPNNGASSPRSHVLAEERDADRGDVDARLCTK